MPDDLGKEALSHLPLTADDKNVRPLTTLEEDRHSSGQRGINLIWEFTQALIAACVTGAKIFLAIRMIMNPSLDNAFFLVIGFYFGRTNHQRVGGVDLGR